MLTAQKKLFARGIVAGLNQTEAAIAAGYSESTARIQASQLMKQPEIIREIERLKQPEPIADAYISDPDQFLEHLMNDQRRVNPMIAKDAAEILLKHRSNTALTLGRVLTRQSPRKQRDTLIEHARQTDSGMTIADWSTYHNEDLQ